MKSIIIFCISFLILIGFTDAQSNFTIDFEQSDTVLKIDPLAGNLWQIGKPSKPIFNSAYLGLNAIVTDTLLPYPVNNKSSFTITLKGYTWFMGCASEMFFYHRFNTDTLRDGGYIDVSYDGGLHWQNIIFDTIMKQSPANPYVDSIPYVHNCYGAGDTISGAIPAFSGNSNGWIETKIQWCFSVGVKSWPPDSVMIRFNFKSDGFQKDDKDGWMIDNIRFYTVLQGSLSNPSENSIEIQVSPNPARNETTLIFDNNERSQFNLVVYSCLGDHVFSKNTMDNNVKIPLSAFKSGIYFYRLTSPKSATEGKFIVE